MCRTCTFATGELLISPSDLSNFLACRRSRTSGTKRSKIANKPIVIALETSASTIIHRLVLVGDMLESQVLTVIGPPDLLKCCDSIGGDCVRPENLFLTLVATGASLIWLGSTANQRNPYRRRPHSK